MADNDEITNATTKIVEAITELVRVAKAQPNGIVASEVTFDKDSPAWLNAHRTDAEVGELGERYLKTHLPATVTEQGGGITAEWEPQRGATWKDLARIYRRLFDADEAFDGKELKEVPYPKIQMLQKLLMFYDVKDPDKTLPVSQLNWPTATGFPPAPSDPVTVRQAIADYLSFYNKAYDGDPADRNSDFDKKPAGDRMQLTHGQCVELHHLFITQEDIRLLAPWDAVSTRIW